MEIGALLREKRKKKGLTMKKLADIVEVSEGTISRWESGDIKNIKRAKIEKLSDVLEISPYTIMGWKEPKEPEVAKVDVFINELKDITSDANEATKRAILDYAYFALERQKKGGIAHVTEEN